MSLYFLSLPYVEMAIERVALRVSQGGHDVTEAVIRRRFASGLNNFHCFYKLAVDKWALYDNSGPALKLIDFGESKDYVYGTLSKYKVESPEKFKKLKSLIIIVDKDDNENNAFANASRQLQKIFQNRLLLL